MTAAIEIQFPAGSTFTSNTTTITVSGGTFALDSNEFLSFSGTFPFAALNISSGTISFYNSASGAAPSGSISIPVTKGSGDPTIVVSNFSGAVTLSWPSSTGPQYQALSPGDPIALTGFTG